MIDYYAVINKYISADQPVHRIYVIHVTMVTAKALSIGRKLGLPSDQLAFIEEASMLHDIGIIHTDAPTIACHGNLPYIMHVKAGKRILSSEGLPDHARIAENHIGVGNTTSEEIIQSGLSLPAEAIICEKLEDMIISYADLFYSKVPGKLFEEKSLNQIRSEVSNYGKKHMETLELWIKAFE
ncbi:MAG TPA: HD domain-containing protein [Cyclobacteriaceae bacterium]